jgi:uncharacterized protein (TIGR03435 family)
MKAAHLFLTFISLPILTLAQSAPVPASPPAFDAATIKPPIPGAGRIAGFYGKPGGRIFFGGTVKILIMVAFDVQDFQIARDQNTSQWFEINAVPPETSPSRRIELSSMNPTPEQHLMLQTLLRDRFGLKYHFETKEGEVYILTRGGKPLQLKPPKDPASVPGATVTMRPGDIYDGESEGNNTTTDYLAKRLTRYLQLPVVNETGITGSYDYYLPPQDPDNQDLHLEVLRIVDRLGLQIKRGRGPIKTLVIDQVQQPSEN